MVRKYRSDGDQWRLLKPAARRMRHESTPAEEALWEALRGGRLAGIRFRRQHAIGRYVVDFYSAQANLVVEVDRSIHEAQVLEDATRDAFLRSQGVQVLRVRNQDVMERLPWVLKQIANRL